jgi:hypothetical protein
MPYAPLAWGLPLLGARAHAVIRAPIRPVVMPLPPYTYCIAITRAYCDLQYIAGGNTPHAYGRYPPPRPQQPIRGRVRPDMTLTFYVLPQIGPICPKGRLMVCSVPWVSAVNRFGA